MSKDKIIAAAKECGYWSGQTIEMNDVGIERFYAVAFEAGRQAEREERNQLRDLLRPFAALLQEHNRKGPDDQPIFQINDAAITLGDLRRALAATEQKP